MLKEIFMSPAVETIWHSWLRRTLQGFGTLLIGTKISYL